MNFLPFLQENNETVLASAALEAKLSNIFEQLKEQIQPIVFRTAASTQPTGLNNYNCCGTYLDITDQIPHWVLVEKEERGGNVLTIFDFIQKYYDWLYCDETCGGSDYLLENKLLDIIDIEKTKEKYYKRLYYAYFPEYDSSEVLLDDSDNVITDATISKFVKNIKTKFYTKKGSLESLRIFFKTIFSIETPLVRYPKKQILRLNAGAFYSNNFNHKFSGATYPQTIDFQNIENEIVGSYLNHNRFQDGGVFTDYTYILNATENQSYKELYKRLIHPAGLNCILEFDTFNYEPPGATYIEDTDICEETTLLVDYSPYRLNETYVSDNYDLYVAGGFTYYGLTYTNGCTLFGDFGEYPCHFFPNWTINSRQYTNFLDIPISAMFLLCRINNVKNPNISIPEC